MIVIKIDDKNSLEKALKKYKRKFDNLKIVKQLRERKEFKKISVKRREQIKKAQYIENKFRNIE
jgi:small subunit ribosomal protein S21